MPGSPRVLERTVDLLVADGDAAGVEVEVLPAMSFLDLAWVRLGVDPLEDGVRLVDGHRFAEAAAGERGPLLVAHCHNRRVLSDIKLAFEDETPAVAVVLQRLGLPDERVVEVAWADLDRAVEPDHLTSVYVPAARRAGGRRARPLRRAGPHAARAVPVGPRADPRVPHPLPARGGLRGARGHQR